MLQKVVQNCRQKRVPVPKDQWNRPARRGDLSSRGQPFRLLSRKVDHHRQRRRWHGPCVKQSDPARFDQCRRSLGAD